MNYMINIQNNYTKDAKKTTRDKQFKYIREIRIKTAVRYHLKLVRVAVTNKSTNNKY